MLIVKRDTQYFILLNTSRVDMFLVWALCMCSPEFPQQMGLSCNIVKWFSLRGVVMIKDGREGKENEKNMVGEVATLNLLFLFLLMHNRYSFQPPALFLSVHRQA